MADKDGNIIAKDYGIGIKPPAQHFHVKGHENAGWGMKARLSQIFAADGRTIMLAFDHGYIMGSTAGLERLDLVIPPLMDHADCLMATRGALRTCIPADNRKAIALRCSADSSVLKDDMSMGVIGTDIEEALRMNASCMAVQCFLKLLPCTIFLTISIKVNVMVFPYWVSSPLVKRWNVPRVILL